MQLYSVAEAGFKKWFLKWKRGRVACFELEVEKAETKWAKSS
jgi:hypothetical protein